MSGGYLVMFDGKQKAPNTYFRGDLFDLFLLFHKQQKMIIIFSRSKLRLDL
jgi:hypothetical protein